MEEREEKNGVDNSGNEIDPGDLRPRMTHPPFTTRPFVT